MSITQLVTQVQPRVKSVTANLKTFNKWTRALVMVLEAVQKLSLIHI